MKKKRVQKRPPSQNEMKLEMVTSRASNAYAQIHQEMARAMGAFKQGTSGRKYSKSSGNLIAEAARATERAVRLVDALRRDLLVVPALMQAIASEQAGPMPPAPEPGPRLLEV